MDVASQCGSVHDPMADLSQEFDGFSQELANIIHKEEADNSSK